MNRPAPPGPAQRAGRALRRLLGDLGWAVRLSFLFLRFQWSVRATLRAGVLLSLANSAVGLLGWFFLGQMFRSVQVASLESYDQDYLAYVLTGSFIATVFGAGRLFSPGGFFQRGIFGADFKRWSMSPTDPLLYNLVANRVLDFVGYTLTSVAIQFVVVFGLFGLGLGVDLNLRLTALPLAMLYLLYAALVQVLYETAVNSLFLHSHTLRAVGQNVPAALLATLAHVVSGQTFPVEALPRWLLALTWLFPQAQGLVGARLLLSPQEGAPSLCWPRLAALTVQLLVYGGLALWLVRTGVARVRREGLVQVPPV